MLYVIEAEGTNLFKIGKADDPFVRFQQLTTMSPVPLHLLHIIQSDTSIKAEGYLHRKYADRRAHGEWFQLTQEDLDQLMLLDAVNYGICGLQPVHLTANFKPSHYCLDCDKIPYQWTDSEGTIHKHWARPGQPRVCLQPKPNHGSEIKFAVPPSQTYQDRKLINRDADMTCLRLLNALRDGKFCESRASIEELERLYTYAGSCPSNAGFNNLLHILRQLLTNRGDALTNLVAIGEDYLPPELPVKTG